MIPSWGLHQYFDVDEQPEKTADESGVGTVRLMLVAAMVVLGVAAFAHVIRYVLLLINRSVLLHPLIAIAGVVIGLLASVLAMLVVVITVVSLVRWLITRRAAGYAEHGEVDPRSTRTLWLGCLVPGVNLVMAPVFVWELAALEARLSHLRRPIVVWWIAWVFSAVVAGWSMVSTVYVTFFNNTPQNIADNTVMTIVGYLLALATFLLTAKVFTGFEGSGTTAERSVRRWVVVPPDTSGPEPAPADPEAAAPSQNGEDSAESAVPVESQGQNPAA
ncbi:transmembrane protein [Mycolicibacterium neworleansense]|uniref:Transmembrane protein n=2 Tax=Mycolicibacterium neworleansense TaxID=146018 RepID=A0A0H5RVG2_9MYCO|nr:transmembrane protein [Mycolicibacterium neworleansense]